MKKLSGFSLMEMMIVLLIVSIIAGAAAPIINKKLITAASEKSPWVWLGTGNNIGYNVLGDEKTALIGGVSLPLDGEGEDLEPRLYINNNGNAPYSLYLENNDNKIPHIGLKSGGDGNPMNIYTGNNSLRIANDYKDGPGDNSISIGNRSKSTGKNSLAFGNGAVSTGENSITIGYFKREKARDNDEDNLILIGAPEPDDTVNETYEFEYNESAVGIGNRIRKLGKHSVAIGSKYGSTTHVPGAASVEIGVDGYSSGDYSIAIKGTAPTNYSIASGHSATAGSGSDATTTDAIAIGYQAKAPSLTSLALGSRANASAERSIAIGCGYTDGSTNNWLTTAQGYASLAIGSGADASTNNSIALGYNATAGYKDDTTDSIDDTTTDAIAIGHGAKAKHKNSVAIGNDVTTTAANQIVLGDKDTTVYIRGRLIVDERFIMRAFDYNPPYSDQGLRLIYGNGSDYLRFGYSEYTGPFSDRRLKNVGKAFKGGLEEIKKLEVFNYTFKKDKSKTPRVGVMAQDLEKIFPSAVTKGEDGFLRIRMEDIFYALVNAVKELDAKIDILAQKQKKIDELEDKVTKLELENKEFAKRLLELEKKIK